MEALLAGIETDVAVGNRVVAALVQVEGPDGSVVLSTRRAPSRRQWARMSHLGSVGNLGAIERAAVPDATSRHIGKLFPLKVIEADQRRDRLILSEKAAARQLRRRRR